MSILFENAYFFCGFKSNSVHIVQLINGVCPSTRLTFHVFVWKRRRFEKFLSFYLPSVISKKHAHRYEPTIQFLKRMLDSNSWCHCFRKALFSGVHSQSINLRLQKRSRWSAFLKISVFGAFFIVYVWTEGETQRNIRVFKCVDGELIFPLHDNEAKI